MLINYEKSIGTFHLKTSKTSYILKVLESGHVSHLYWGKRIESNNLDYLTREHFLGSFLANTDNIYNFQLEATMQEYPGFGSVDLRSPAIEIQFEDGSTTTDFRYEGYNIIQGKAPLKGLPSTYVESESEAATLEIYLRDKLKNIKLILTYNVFEEFDAITKNVKIINESEEEVNILRALSANVDFAEDDFDFIQLSGSWGRERHIIRRKLRAGSQAVESRRGASSHGQNPFMALARKGTTDLNGEAYGFSLVYSGNFLANAEVDMYCNTRAQIGINPFDFKWLLEKGEEFQTPEAVLVYSPDGLNGMSQIYHNLYGRRLCRGKYRDEVRPVLINNWEATYFDFNETKIKELASEASKLGIELFVLDDGWFGVRNDDTSGLGDWFVNEDKVKGGLGKLATEINEMGLKFGLWFEPEMVSPNSELYKKHPDWCIHVPGRNRSEARNQLILDLSKEEVCDYIIEAVSNVLDSAPISYVKWDMNRNMTEVGSTNLCPKRQRETAHRYMLGLYRILEKITNKFPEILFESCSGGGGRFDPGMLYYMPQTWTSDDTDAIERLKIQFGTSMVYPNASMGCHVSAVPNHQVYRNTPLQTRGIAAMAGNFGYELNLLELTEEEKDEIKEQVVAYKEIREIVQFGDMYRLLSPFEKSEVAWITVSKDKNEAVVGYVRKYAEPNKLYKPLKVTGLDPNAKYSIYGCDKIFGGDELMYIGLVIPELKGDYAAYQWRLKRI